MAPPPHQLPKAISATTAPDFLLVHLLGLLPARQGLALDAGSGAGRNLGYLSEAGYQVVTLDRAVGARAALRGDVRALPVREGVFDLVLCDSVLDTWFGPGHDKALAELKRVLHPGGTLLLVTAAKEGSDEPAGARVTGRDELLAWMEGLSLVEVLYVRVDYPPAAGVRAQWAVAARRLG